jgi:hypothetical protein
MDYHVRFADKATPCFTRRRQWVSNVNELTKYQSPRQLLLETPLYEALTEMTVPQVTALFLKSFKVDGHCRQCKSQTTFGKSGASIHGSFSSTDLQELNRIVQLTLTCARDDSHIIHFYVWINGTEIQKIGQLPSFADIAIDESKNYTKLLRKNDIAEFHKAIGLAAHGVGIGSYVYLRRIFERLIDKRYNEHKVVEGWADEEFYKKRMVEKIEHLARHLPEFLVRNAKLYSILSIGLHELNEADCLAFFPVLRQSTIWILEQDKKKQEEIAQQKELEKAIASFRPAKVP